MSTTKKRRTARAPAPESASGCVVVCPLELGRGKSRLARSLRASFAIAVDGGLAHMKTLGLEPALWVGDADSVKPNAVKSLSCPRLMLPRSKDYTDLEYALHAAGSAYLDGAWSGELLLLGAQGGRLDHELGNMMAVGRWLEDMAQAVGVEGCPSVTCHGPRGFWVATVNSVSFNRAKGEVFSILVFGRSPSLTITGARYTLKDGQLDHSTSGISNEGLGCQVVVKVTSNRTRTRPRRSEIPVAVFVMMPEGR